MNRWGSWGQVANWLDLSPGGNFCERDDYRQVILPGRLRTALDHHYLTDGVDIELAADSLGERRHCKVWLIDIEDLENND